MGANKLPYLCYTLQIQPVSLLEGLPTPKATAAVTALLDLLAKFHKMESFARQIGIWQMTAANLISNVKSSLWLRQYMQHNLLATAVHLYYKMVHLHCNISMSYNPFGAIYYLLLTIVGSIFALNRIPSQAHQERSEASYGLS